MLPAKQPSKTEPNVQKATKSFVEALDAGPVCPLDPKQAKPQQKLLFTVKPGGIAGYLGEHPLSLCCFQYLPYSIASLCNTVSYVDIRAKTDTYVGLLPLPALERILEKRPIVLLTLAKRLISLLSPLGNFH